MRRAEGMEKLTEHTFLRSAVELDGKTGSGSIFADFIMSKAELLGGIISALSFLTSSRSLSRKDLYLWKYSESGKSGENK